jgi:hypothetical protein
MTDSDLRAARHERARRWAQGGGSLHGYPALAPENETEETLAAAPVEKAERKPKPASEPAN